ncbi:MAG TPA: cyclic-phosphate processing receiver domain-containing protein [Urbifossiella sp.]|nr:cyclic-phosphate processing receiver domain-containing protein [Urbifossiella sp.]
MAPKIVILEDNADRREAMRPLLADRFSDFDTHFFDNAPETIDFLAAHLAGVVAIALDNDLDMKPGPDGRAIDQGEGRHVADFLAGRPPACPVVIHTTNAPAAAAMQEALRNAGWKTRRVIPFDDMAWIASDWFPAVRRAIVGPTRRPRLPRSQP